MHTLRIIVITTMIGSVAFIKSVDPIITVTLKSPYFHERSLPMTKKTAARSLLYGLVEGARQTPTIKAVEDDLCTLANKAEKKLFGSYLPISTNISQLNKKIPVNFIVNRGINIGAAIGIQLAAQYFMH